MGTGTGMTTSGTTGNLIVTDADSLEKLYEISLLGQPQASMLLTNAYEEETGHIYLYTTYNAKPGGISMLKLDPTATTGAGAELIELYDAAGFEEFCIASLICGPDGTLYYKNDSANVLAIGQPEARGVVRLINSIGKVDADSGSAITIARNAYDSLQEAEKAGVDNYSLLQEAEAVYDAIREKIAAVIDAIDNIASVQYDAASKRKIEDARNAYDALNTIEQKHITNYAELTDAEAQYIRLDNAQKVINLIDAIGDVNAGSEKLITAARRAYDALSNAEKVLVSNYSKLTASERRFAALTEDGSEDPDAKPEGTDKNESRPTDEEPKPTDKDKDKDKGQESKTKVIGDDETESTSDEEKRRTTIDGVEYTVAEDAATLMERISALAGSEGEPDDEDIIDIYLVYIALEDDVKAQVYNYDDLEAMLNKLGVENHHDEKNGMVAEGLDWNIRLVVEEINEGSSFDTFDGSIGANDLVMVWDIKLVDIITGNDFQPDLPVRLRVKAPNISQYEQIRIAHILADGRIEYYDCTVEDGYIVWETKSFSPYALIGNTGETLRVLAETSSEEDTLPTEDPVATEQEPSQPTPTWLKILIVALAVIGVIALVAAVLINRRRKD